MQLLFAILGIPLMCWLDRQRGTPKIAEIIPKLPALLGMGYLCAAYTGHVFDWQTLVIMVGVWVAHGIGFGEPLGHALTGVGGSVSDDGTIYEPWQVTNLLKNNPWVALTLRGLFVGVATLLALDWETSLKISIAFGIAFPVAPAVIRYVIKMPTITIPEQAVAWGVQEKVRGAIIGLILFLLWL